MVIVLEGCDGCGKSTIAQLLKERIEKLGRKVCITHEPYASGSAKEIKDILDNESVSTETEALLYAAARTQHIEDVILPAIERGEDVILDRFITSSIVYQGIVNRLGMENIKKINSFASSKISYYKEFFIDVKPEVCLERMKSRTELSRYDKQPLEYHKKVYDGFKTVYTLTPSIERVNGELKVEDVVDIIMTSLRNF